MNRSEYNDLRCKLCGASSFHMVRQFSNYGTSILSCEKCGLMQSYPFPDPNKIYERYQENFYTSEGYRFKGWAEILSHFFRIRRAVFIDKRFGPKRSLLDVGCGRGIMIYELKKRGWAVSGTQISETAAIKIRNSFHIKCFIGDLTSSPFPEHSFDIITMWHVLEHLPDPFLYLNYCRKLLKPGGYLLIEVPNANSWSSRVTQDAWMGWDPLYHLYHFTPYTLAGTFKKTGFIPLKWSYFSWEYGPFITLQSLLNLLGSRDALFAVLKINPYLASSRDKINKNFLSIFGKALFLAAPALLLSFISAVCLNGEIIHVVAKPKA